MEGCSDADYSFDNTDLTSNMEDYLEQIEFLSRKNKVVRVKDIAKNLGIKMPSVTAALQKLEEKGLINYEKYGFIDLTEKGKELADRVCRRHSFLSDFFYKVLRMSKIRADKVACHVEHHLTPEACRQIYKLIDFHQSEKEKRENWTIRLDEILSIRALSDLHEGDTGTLLKINGSSPLIKRLTEMGFKKGEKIKVLQYAPLKDPIKISIKDYNLSLRVDEAKKIAVRYEGSDE